MYSFRNTKIQRLHRKDRGKRGGRGIDVFEILRGNFSNINIVLYIYEMFKIFISNFSVESKIFFIWISYELNFLYKTIEDY